MSNHYLGNPLLKNSNVKIEYTKEQIDEYMKCSDDPIYFIKNYIKIVNLDKGLVNFDLYPFQEKIINTVHNNRFTICKIPRQSGKCVYINTTVTLRNKKTGEIKEISVGNFYEMLKSERKTL